jgi:hypothetical protein
MSRMKVCKPKSAKGQRGPQFDNVSARDVFDNIDSVLVFSQGNSNQDILNDIVKKLPSLPKHILREIVSSHRRRNSGSGSEPGGIGGIHLGSAPERNIQSAGGAVRHKPGVKVGSNAVFGVKNVKMPGPVPAKLDIEDAPALESPNEMNFNPDQSNHAMNGMNPDESSRTIQPESAVISASGDGQDHPDGPSWGSAACQRYYKFNLAGQEEQKVSEEEAKVPENVGVFVFRRTRENDQRGDEVNGQRLGEVNGSGNNIGNVNGNNIGNVNGNVNGNVSAASGNVNGNVSGNVSGNFNVNNNDQESENVNQADENELVRSGVDRRSASSGSEDVYAGLVQNAAYSKNIDRMTI